MTFYTDTGFKTHRPHQRFFQVRINIFYIYGLFKSAQNLYQRNYNPYKHVCCMLYSVIFYFFNICVPNNYCSIDIVFLVSTSQYRQGAVDHGAHTLVNTIHFSPSTTHTQGPTTSTYLVLCTYIQSQFDGPPFTNIFFLPWPQHRISSDPKQWALFSLHNIVCMHLMLWLKQYKVIPSHNMFSSLSCCHTVSAIVALVYIHISLRSHS